ncbi:MAG: hypothetical protein ACI9WC_003627, partial [Arenicella sp.]
MNKVTQITVVIMLSTLVAGQALASAANDLQRAKNTAISKQISASADWRHLIQYTSRLFGGVSSEIKSQQSFFASNGSTDPQRELIATLEAMFLPLKVGESPDAHPRCEFIARYEFLNDLIDFPDEVDSIDCIRFKQWVSSEKVDSISLVFASGYFKNPASFYGHPLLKFNMGNAAIGGLLDTTINNGAIVPANENPVVYMIRGIFGGYEAAFSDTKFYRLNHSYSESDLRDLWDYQLDLTQAQKKRVIYYSWELLGQRFTYKFFSNNCGYFLEDLLQYALGKRISPRNRLYTVPSNTFFNLMETTNNGKPLVKNIVPTASRHSRLNENYAALNKPAQAAVHNYLRTQSIAQSFDQDQQRKIIDTLTDYYSFLISKSDNQDRNKEYTTKRTMLYAKRLRLKKTPLVTNHKASSTAPHTGSR